MYILSIELHSHLVLQQLISVSGKKSKTIHVKSIKTNIMLQMRNDNMLQMRNTNDLR